MLTDPFAVFYREYAESVVGGKHYQRTCFKLKLEEDNPPKKMVEPEWRDLGK